VRPRDEHHARQVGGKRQRERFDRGEALASPSRWNPWQPIVALQAFEGLGIEPSKTAVLFPRLKHRQSRDYPR
jgi:hypothetical protein